MTAAQDKHIPECVDCAQIIADLEAELAGWKSAAGIGTFEAYHRAEALEDILAQDKFDIASFRTRAEKAEASEKDAWAHLKDAEAEVERLNGILWYAKIVDQADGSEKIEFVFDEDGFYEAYDYIKTRGDGGRERPAEAAARKEG